MKKAVWGAFVLMTAFAATGLCEMDYTLTNPHIRYEKIEGAQQAEEAAQTDGAGISLSEMAAAEDVQQQEQQNADTWPKTFTVTLGGDTTLGSTDDLRKRDDCFENVAAEKGYGWFFSGLQTLFATDDLTLINFEGTLTDETSKKQKLYNFKGPAEYADILTLGSVEAVNVANNHTLDYGQQGKEDTIANLEAAGIIVSGGGQLGIFEKNGVKVGMTGYCFPYKDGKKDISADVKALREAGCHRQPQAVGLPDQGHQQQGRGEQVGLPPDLALQAAGAFVFDGVFHVVSSSQNRSFKVLPRAWQMATQSLRVGL